MFGHYINGKIVAGEGRVMNVTCPATDEVLESFNAASKEQALYALESAQEAFKTWSKLSINERGVWIQRYIEALEEEMDTLVDLEAKETGKNYPETASAVNENIHDLAWYVEQVKREEAVILPDPRVKPGEQYQIMGKYPIGVVVGHIAWNHPIYGVCCKIGPALASGCTCVIKPSSQTPLGALYMGKVAEKIGFPKGVLNFIAGPSAEIGKAMNESTIPSMIGVIGSCETGREVMRQGATSIKRYSLELGGNSPCIIMPDADLNMAVSWVTDRKMQACGQGCTNVNRVYVHESIHDQVVSMFQEEIRKVKVGFGKELGKVVGPQVLKSHRDFVLELIDDAVSKGAKLLYGGGIPAGMEKGNFIEPTLLDQVTDEMRMCNEEIFGPVIAIYTFRDLDEVIRRSNHTHFGLAAYLYTYDARVISRCSEELGFGMVNVNSPNCGGAFIPHVGIKESGLGCDHSRWSLDEYYYLRRTSIKL